MVGPKELSVNWSDTNGRLALDVLAMPRVVSGPQDDRRAS